MASALSASLASNHNEETHFIYDRKDQKLHGEKGDIVGTFKNGNTIIVDDVITAGTAIKNTLVNPLTPSTFYPFIHQVATVVLL